MLWVDRNETGRHSMRRDMPGPVLDAVVSILNTTGDVSTEALGAIKSELDRQFTNTMH